MPNREERKSIAYHSRDSWSHARVVTTELPSGKSVDIELPDLMAYAVSGLIPNDLRNIAHLIEKSVELKLDEISDEEREDFYKLQVWMIATHLKKPDLVKELGSEEKAIEWVSENVPRSDRWFLWQHVMQHGIASDVLEALTRLARQGVGNGGMARFPGVGNGTGGAEDSPRDLTLAE